MQEQLWQANSSRHSTNICHPVRNFLLLIFVLNFWIFLLKLKTIFSIWYDSLQDLWSDSINAALSLPLLINHQDPCLKVLLNWQSCYVSFINFTNNFFTINLILPSSSIDHCVRTNRPVNHVCISVTPEDICFFENCPREVITLLDQVN